MRDFFSRHTGLLLVLLALSIGPGRGGQTATFDDPASQHLTFTKGTTKQEGRPIKPGEVFNVVAIKGDDVTIADAEGFQATVSRIALTITDSSSLTDTNSTSEETPPTDLFGTPYTPPPPTKAANAPPVAANLSPDDAKIIKQLNDIFQLNLFATANLWDEAVGKVAGRLEWPRESKTDIDESYRLYALDGGAPILGTKAYSLALYGRKGHPTYISIVFANKGDLPEAVELEKLKLSHGAAAITDDEMQKVTKALNAAVKSDADAINAQLTTVLGPPETHVYGPTANSRESVHRWNWKGHAILFSAPKNEYAAIKIVPSDVADHSGDVDNMDRDAIRQELARHISKKDNSDAPLPLP